MAISLAELDLPMYRESFKATMLAFGGYEFPEPIDRPTDREVEMGSEKYRKWKRMYWGEVLYPALERAQKKIAEARYGQRIEGLGVHYDGRGNGAIGSVWELADCVRGVPGTVGE